MYKALPSLILLFAIDAIAGSDIWESLFNEKRQEAALGDSDAQYDVGAMYQNGRGVSADRNQAIEWYRKAAAQNNPDAISRLDLMQASAERFEREKKRAQNGDTESQYELGNMYAKGIGTMIDPEQSRQWYEKAASQGHIKAGYRLGLIYHEGSGARKNSKTAFDWFREAAEKGYAPAQYYLGKLYAAGEGVDRDYRTALNWFTQAVDGGFIQARDELHDVSEKLKARNRSADSPGKTGRIGTAAKVETERTAQPQATDSFTLQDLMRASWNRDTEPVAYLPSAISDCNIEDRRMICNTAERVRETAGNHIRYRSRSIISDFSEDGSFRIVYRNLVLASTPIEGNAGNDTGAIATYTIKTGWGKQHTLECTLKDDRTVSCAKDSTRAIELNSRQQLTAGR